MRESRGHTFSHSEPIAYGFPKRSQALSASEKEGLGCTENVVTPFDVQLAITAINHTNVEIAMIPSWKNATRRCSTALPKTS